MLLPTTCYQTSSWALDLPSRGYCPARKPHFSQINYDVDLATAQSKIKTSIFSLPQPPLPPAVLTEIVTDVWGPFVVHWICESIQGCYLLRRVSCLCIYKKCRNNASLMQIYSTTQVHWLTNLQMTAVVFTSAFSIFIINSLPVNVCLIAFISSLLKSVKKYQGFQEAF